MANIENLTVIIPTRNRADVLRQSLEHMQECGLADLNYLVYDDASDEPSRTLHACSFLKRVTVIQGKDRVGQAEGRNILLRNCDTPYAAMMDDDTWFTETAALPGLLENELFYKDFGRSSAVCAQVIRTTDYITVFPRQPRPVRVLSPLGMGCIVRVEDILLVGGFHGFFRYRHEETELGLRLWAHALTVIHDPRLEIAHSHTPTARSSYEYDLLSARNLILMHGFNFPGVNGIPLGFARALRLLLCRGVHHAAVAAGCLHGLRDYIRHRREATIMSSERYKELKAMTTLVGRNLHQ